MLQTGLIAFFMERDPQAWVLSSGLEVGASLFTVRIHSSPLYR